MENGSKILKIFLSGSVKKGEKDQRSEEFFWSEEEEKMFKQHLGENIEILNPNLMEIPKYRYRERFAKDIEMLSQSDVVVVDARTKKGIGIGAEMVIAKQKGIPVFTLCPLGSQYHGKEEKGEEVIEWFHPFIAEFSDKIFETLDDLISEVKKSI